MKNGNIKMRWSMAPWVALALVAAGMAATGISRFSDLRAQQNTHAKLPAHSDAAGRIGQNQVQLGRMEERIGANGNAITQLRYQLEREGDKRERENTEVKSLLHSVLEKVTK